MVSSEQTVKIVSSVELIYMSVVRGAGDRARATSVGTIQSAKCLGNIC